MPNMDTVNILDIAKMGYIGIFELPLLFKIYVEQ